MKEGGFHLFSFAELNFKQKDKEESMVVESNWTSGSDHVVAYIDVKLECGLSETCNKEGI